MFGGLEAGGTKFVCAVGTGPDDLVTHRIPTTTPAETLAAALSWFRARDIRALGIGSFGPVSLHPGTLNWGRVTTTPKPGWEGAEIAGVFARGLGVPVAFDTDVNAAAVGERRWGAAQGLDTFLYLTVGTGIGGGGYASGKRLHGLIHPEMGHILAPRAPGDSWPGHCRFHGACLEGLASGPAIAARCGVPAEDLPRDHTVWPLVAHTLAHGVYTLLCALSPERIILGGGVASQPHLLQLVRKQLAELLGGYFAHPVLDDLDTFLVPPGLGNRSGALGALALAEEVA